MKALFSGSILLDERCCERVHSGDGELISRFTFVQELPGFRRKAAKTHCKQAFVCCGGEKNKTQNTQPGSQQQPPQSHRRLRHQPATEAREAKANEGSGTSSDATPSTVNASSYEGKRPKQKVSEDSGYMHLLYYSHLFLLIIPHSNDH